MRALEHSATKVLKLLLQAPKVDIKVQNKAQVRASEGWIVVSVNHKHVDLSNVANYNTCVKTKQALRT